MSDAVRDTILKSAAVLGEMAGPLAAPTARAADLMVETLRGGHRIYVCGNGGSASQAQHIAGELVGRFLFNRPALPCVALASDAAVLTAIANDYSVDQLFERQVEALVREGDLLWALSTSGSSPNVLRAAAKARELGAKVVGMTGRTGGKMKDLCDVLLCVPADTSPLIQEGHLVLLHVLCAIVERSLFGGQGSDAFSGRMEKGSDPVSGSGGPREASA